MLRRLGGVFVLLLGSVIIASGVSDSGGVTVGSLPQCAPSLLVGSVQPSDPCPVGNIRITETTTGTGSVPAPATWTVTISSPNCFLPDATTSTQVQVPNNQAASSMNLYVYRYINKTSELCQYQYTVDAVTGFTTAFAPAGPVTIPTRTATADVALNATAAGSTTSMTPTSSAPITDIPSSDTPSSDTPSSDVPSSAPASSSSAASATTTSRAASSTGILPTQASRTDAAPIANTGTDHIGGTLVLGILLVLLGLAIVFEPRLRRLFARGGRHSA